MYFFYTIRYTHISLLLYHSVWPRNQSDPQCEYGIFAFMCLEYLGTYVGASTLSDSLTKSTVRAWVRTQMCKFCKIFMCTHFSNILCGWPQTARVATGSGGGMGRRRVRRGRSAAAAGLRALHLPTLPRTPGRSGKIQTTVACCTHVLQVSIKTDFSCV